MDLINKELLFKYFAGNATVFEKKQIDEWSKTPAHQEIFYALLMLWEQQNPQFKPDLETALTSHFERMEAISVPETVEVETPSWKWWRWAVAASVVLLLGLGWLFRSEIQYQTYRTDFGKTQDITLSDGSRVSLNANSWLRVPRFGFGSRTREVLLSGEAAFSVVHTLDDQQFVVKTNRNFDVVVLGTEFTVYSRERGAKVVLNKGKVQLRYQQGHTAKEVVMKPGDLVLIDPQNEIKQTIAPEPEHHAAWKEHRFVFDETTLQEINALFAEHFGVQVTVADDSLAHWTVSGSFTAQTADELLETLTEAANLKYRKQGTKIVIYTE